MSDKKQSLYELLGVSQTASLEEIKGAHLALSRRIISNQEGLAREEVTFRLKALDLALHTLSSPQSREYYDLELAAHAPPGNADTLQSGALTVISAQAAPYNAVVVADALEETFPRKERTSLVSSDSLAPLKILSATTTSSFSALKTIFRLIGGLIVLGIIFQVSVGMRNAANPSGSYVTEKAKAEEKVVIQDYYQKYGVRLASRAEAEMLEMENQRKLNEQQQEAREQARQAAEYQRFVESGRQQGEEISRNLQLAEERARAEEERARREAEWARQREEERARQEAEWASQREEVGQRWDTPEEEVN